ncbi:MAG: hypothetical protein WC775_01545 [Patescibacteria group bacterium]|jgi:hypothetical protein
MSELKREAFDAQALNDFTLRLKAEEAFIAEEKRLAAEAARRRMAIKCYSLVAAATLGLLVAWSSLSSSNGSHPFSGALPVPSRLPISTIVPTSTPTVEPTIRATPVRTPARVSPTTTLEPTVTPVDTKPNYTVGSIDFSQELPISMSIKLTDGTEFMINEQLVLYHDGMTDSEKAAFSQKTAAGTGKAVINYTHEGGVLMFGHSGWMHEKPLEFEALRHYLEGGDITHLDSMLSEKERAQRMKNLEGAAVTINGKLFVIANVTYIPYDQVEPVTANMHAMVSNVARVTGGKSSPFAEYLQQGTQVLIPIFCGIGPGKSLDEIATYSRYVIAVEPLQQ